VSDVSDVSNVSYDSDAYPARLSGPLIRPADVRMERFPKAVVFHLTNK
jgi:hypothetical protein